MKIKTLKPKAGVRVRKPDGAYLDAAGEDLALTSFWLRRIAEGDLNVSDIQPHQKDVAIAEQPATKPTAEK